MTTTVRRAYTKRYERPDNPPNFQLTQRAVRINTEICRRPLIRKDQLRALFPDISDRPFDQITSNLFQGGFVAHPRQQQEVHNTVSGSLPTYLSPDRLGRQLHSAFFADPLPTPKFTQENDRGRWDYIKHQPSSTTTVMQFEAGARAVPNVQHFTQAVLWMKYAPNSRLNQPVFDPDDFPRLMSNDFVADPLQYVAPNEDPVPLKLKSQIDWSVRLPGSSAMTKVTIPVATEPDDYFAREVSGATKFTFFESDEGTETILPGDATRKSLQLFIDTSLYQKLLVYIAAFRRRAHVKQFGIPSFDVTIITSTPARADNIVRSLGHRLMQQFKVHPNFVLVSDRETIAALDNNPYHPDIRYKNLEGEDVQYVRS